MEGLNTAIMKSLLIRLPSLHEQQKIVSIINKTGELIEKQIVHRLFLQSLKKALMQKLLTGKIRVKV